MLRELSTAFLSRKSNIGANGLSLDSGVDEFELVDSVSVGFGCPLKHIYIQKTKIYEHSAPIHLTQKPSQNCLSVSDVVQCKRRQKENVQQRLLCVAFLSPTSALAQLRSVLNVKRI
jgi:hypothetical protein